MGQKLYAGSRGRPAENFALLDTDAIFASHLYMPVFSLGNIRTPWGDAPKFGTDFSPFIVDQRDIFCGAVSKLRASD